VELNDFKLIGTTLSQYSAGYVTHKHNYPKYAPRKRLDAMPQRITSQAKKSKSPFVVVETEFVNNQKDADRTLLYQMMKFRLIFEQNSVMSSI
jgi:hypothetical protein